MNECPSEAFVLCWGPGCWGGNGTPTPLPWCWGSHLSIIATTLWIILGAEKRVEWRVEDPHSKLFIGAIIDSREATWLVKIRSQIKFNGISCVIFFPSSCVKSLSKQFSSALSSEKNERRYKPSDATSAMPSWWVYLLVVTTFSFSLYSVRITYYQKWRLVLGDLCHSFWD